MKECQYRIARYHDDTFVYRLNFCDGGKWQEPGCDFREFHECVAFAIEDVVGWGCSPVFDGYFDERDDPANTGVIA